MKKKKNKKKKDKNEIKIKPNKTKMSCQLNQNKLCQLPFLIYCSLMAENSSCPAVSNTSNIHHLPSTSVC